MPPSSLLYSEHGSSRLIRNAGKFLSDYEAPGGSDFHISKLQILQYCLQPNKTFFILKIRHINNTELDSKTQQVRAKL